MALGLMARARVVFGEHMLAARIADMCSTMTAYGIVHDGSSGRDYIVEVFRPSNLPGLEETLIRRDINGFLRWMHDTP